MGYRKGQVTLSTEKIDRVIKLRNVAKVKKLKNECERLCLHLLLYKDAPKGTCCILSNNEFEIGEEVQNCSENNENYFLNSTDYELLLENSKYEWL